MNGDPAALARLIVRYDLLKRMLSELRNKLAITDPELDRTAPSIDVFLAALEEETFTKTLDQMSEFVDRELKKAFRDIPPEHPVKLELKRLFKAAVANTVPIVSEKISQGSSFADLMEFLARERRRIAEEVCDLPSKNFGVSRETRRPRMERTIFTTKGRFKHYWERALALIPEGIADFVIPRAFDRFVGNALADRVEGFTLWADMCGEKFPLSSYLVCREAPNDVGLDWMFCDDYNAWPAVAIVHTEEHNLGFVRAYCADLFEDIRKRELSLEDLLKAVANLQWYLAHGMFYTRGSAAIAEWLIAGLCRFKGYEITWEKQPDLEALMCLQPATFVSRYPEFTHVKSVSIN